MLHILLMFYASILFFCLIGRPIIRTFVPQGLDSFKRSLVTLSCSVGLLGFLFVFSLLARVIPQYTITVPLTLIFCACGAFLISRAPEQKQKLWSKSDIYFLVSLILLHLFLWWMRTLFPDIEFDSNHFGGEKLYNYQFQQSFLFGSSYPPENLWFAQEPNRYYVLLKAWPGLITYFVRVFWQEFTGGVVFHLVDTFYFALSLVLTAEIMLFLFNVEKKSSLTGWEKNLALSVVLIPLLAGPYRLFEQMFTGELDFWSLTRIIPYTINEYPFWNFIFADNHAHNNAVFLQLFLWWLMALYLLRRDVMTSWVSILIFALAISCLPLGNGPGTLTTGVTLFAALAFLAFMDWKKSSSKSVLKNHMIWGLKVLFTTLLLSLPYILTRQSLPINTYFVPPNLTSDFSLFLNVQMILVSLFIILFLISFRKENFILSKIQIIFVILFCVVLSVLGYSTFVFTGLLFALLILSTDQLSKRALLFGASFFWTFSEVIGSNFYHDKIWMRANTVFKFYYESYFVLACVLILVAREPLYQVWQSRKRLCYFGITLLGVTSLLLIVGHWISMRTRIQRDNLQQNPDGMAYFSRTRAKDAVIIQYLQSLPNRVVIIEECGIHPKKGNYTIYGRISALSGRPAVCGWAHHLILFYQTPTFGQFKGDDVYAHLQKRNTWSRFFYQHSSGAVSPIELQEARDHFRDLGVTHLVFGEVEAEAYPTISVDDVARGLGRVSFKIKDTAMGVVELQ